MPYYVLNANVQCCSKNCCAHEQGWPVPDSYTNMYVSVYHRLFGGCRLTITVLRTICTGVKLQESGQSRICLCSALLNLWQHLTRLSKPYFFLLGLCAEREWDHHVWRGNDRAGNRKGEACAHLFIINKCISKFPHSYRYKSVVVIRAFLYDLTFSAW